MSQTNPGPDGATEIHSSPDAASVRATHTHRLSDYVNRMGIGQLTLALVFCLFLWQWFDAHRQINAMQQELAKRLTEMDGNNKANQVLVGQSQEALRELGAKVASLESVAAEAQSQREALETMYQQMSNTRDETTLAEVEQMLMIASQQLQLAANVKAALVALQQADVRLQRMDRPSFAGMRKAINSDMDRLRALPTADAAGMTLRLDNLIIAVDTLPLNHEVHVSNLSTQVAPSGPVARNENDWQRLWREIWQEAKELVRIEDMRKREMPLLSPTEAFFLRENLKLRLLSSRLALLSRDQVSFRSDLKAAQDWVKRYFDASSGEGKQALLNLQKLGVADIAVDLPDVNTSIEAVRVYRASHEKAAK